MRHAIRFIVLMVAAAGFACFAQTVATSSAAGSDQQTGRAVSSAPLQSVAAAPDIKTAPLQVGYAAPRPAPPSAGDAAPIRSAKALKSRLPNTGYQRIVVNGEERYCRNDLYTGSHAEKNPVCLTKAQWDLQQQRAREYIEQVERLDSELPANPMNIGGLARE